jgi:hypothetical protein
MNIAYSYDADKDVYGRKILKWILRNFDVRVWSVLLWLRIGSSCGLLFTWQ